MKPQHFLVLAIAALLSLTAAVAMYLSSAPWSAEAQGGGALFPALKADAAKVHSVEISQGTKTVVIDRDGDQWRLKSKEGYPAAPDRIRTLLTSLSDAVLTEPKTRSPQRFAVLEVEDAKDPNANSRLVRLLDDKGAVIAEAIVGKLRVGGGGQGKGGTYVRKPGDEQSWLASTDITGGLDTKDWAKTRIFEMPADKIVKVKVEIPGDTPYEVVRGDGGQHKLADIPAGKKVKYVNAIDNIVEATAFVEFQDVHKTISSSADVTTATMETDAGLKVTYKFRRDKDDVWLTISSSGEGDAKKQADELAKLTEGWEFKVVPAAVEAFKRRDELLEDGSS